MGDGSTITNKKTKNAYVERVIFSGSGGVTHEMERATVPLEPAGKLVCGHKLDELPAGTLKRGKYRLQITMVDGGGGILSREAVPLMVR